MACGRCGSSPVDKTAEVGSCGCAVGTASVAKTVAGSCGCASATSCGCLGDDTIADPLLKGRDDGLARILRDLAAEDKKNGRPRRVVAQGRFCHDGCNTTETTGVGQIAPVAPSGDGPPSLFDRWQQTRGRMAKDSRITVNGSGSTRSFRRAAQRTTAKMKIPVIAESGRAPPMGDRELTDLARRMNLAVARAKRARGDSATIQVSTIRAALKHLNSVQAAQPVAFAGGSKGPGLTSFEVCIGDAEFYVPTEWYDAEGYSNFVLGIPSEDEALAWIWPVQMARRASDGLTDDQIDGLWACIDLEREEGAFWKSVNSQGVGGYAGHAFYWLTQYVKMFWEFTADGATVGGATTGCGGPAEGGPSLVESSHRLFEMGIHGARWHVWADRRSLTSSLTLSGHHFYYYPDWDCGDINNDDTQAGDPARVLANCFDTSLDGYPYGFSFVVDGVTYSDLPRSNEIVLKEHSGPVLLGKAACISYVSTKISSAFSGSDLSTLQANAYANHKPCYISFRADLIGQVGLKADYYLHWAHVAAALGVRALGAGSFDEVLTSLPYLHAALLLGKYAAKEIADGGTTFVHELGHIYLPLGNHYSNDYYCCMCSSQIAWRTGVYAYLGLPDGGTDASTLTEYAGIVVEYSSGCSRDLANLVLDMWWMTPVYFDYLCVYCSPGSVYGTRSAQARNCTEEGLADSGAATSGNYEAVSCP